MKARIYRIFAFTLLVFAAPSQADLILVAEIGERAPGFPSDYYYWNVENPVIGGNGHVAFHGAADIVPGPTTLNTEAVWAGRPGDLHVAIKEGETPSGFASSEVVNQIFPGLIVSDSGSVAIKADIAGSRPGLAYLAEVGTTTHGVIQTGGPAPGFDPGVNVANLRSHAFTDAGMAIHGSSTSGAAAIWFWDKVSVQLVISTGDVIDTLFPDCSVTELTDLLGMNQRGEILFSATTAGNGGDCPSQVVLAWKGGTFRKVVAFGDAAPGMPPGTEFRDISPLAVGESINDWGDVTFAVTLYDTDTTDELDSVWVAHADGGFEPLAFDGEAVAMMPGELLDITTASNAVSNADAVSAFLTTRTSGAELILLGPPKVGAVYSDFDDIDTSHLTVLVDSDQRPPGLGSSWYFEDLGAPLVNNNGTVAFWGVVRDEGDPFGISTPAIWMGDAPEDLQLVAAVNHPVTIDGDERILVAVSDITSANTGGGAETTNSGLPNQLSDNGQLVFSGGRQGFSPGSVLSGIYMTAGCPLTTIVRDFNGDCMADLLIRNTITGRLFMWEMDGNEKTWRDIGPLALNREVVGIADLTGDKQADILIRRTDTGYVFMWEMDGNLPTWRAVGSLSLNVDIVGVADLTGDGKADIVRRNRSTGRLSMWVMDSGTPTYRDIGRLALNREVVGIGDLTGDEKADILIRRTDTGYVFMWEMDGNVPTWRAIGSLSLNVDIIGVADLTGDGKADIVRRNRSTGRLSMWVMDSGTPTYRDIGRLALNREIVRLDDLTGDGKADIVIRRTDTGYVFMWEVDGNLLTYWPISPLDLSSEIQPPDDP